MNSERWYYDAATRRGVLIVVLNRSANGCVLQCHEHSGIGWEDVVLPPRKMPGTLATAMTEQEIYDGVITGGTTDMALVVKSLCRHGAGWCVIGGMAVNSYVVPVYTVDFEMVVVATDLAPVLEDLRAAGFRIKEFPYSINAQRRAGPTQRTDSMLMVQFSKPHEMQGFVDRAVLRPVLGFDVPVASLPDLVAIKLAAWSEPARRFTKRSKDQLDLLRLAEVYPEIVEPLLTAELRVDSELNRAHIAAHPEGDGWGGEGEQV